MSEYTPGTYVKGDDERVARNAREAVALAFEGFRLKVEDEAPEAPVETQEPTQTALPATPAPTPQTLAERSKKDDA